MLPTVENEAKPLPAASRASRWRTAVVAVASIAAFFAIIVAAYELAVARVPEHRAALERLVRSQTGLDIRFDELGLRWGWYGPEAVFRRVELGEPGRSAVLLRAPELIVGFDIWQTARSGQLAAGRITLVQADIDFARAAGRRRGIATLVASAAARGARADGVSRGAAHGGVSSRAGGGASTRDARGLGVGSFAVADASGADAVRVLEGWQGGRVDLEGGSLRIPDPAGSANPLTLQIRRASLRRDTSEWSGYGLVFLPERLGRTARVVMRLDGALDHPSDLSGSIRFEGHRLAFGGWRDLLGAAPDANRYLPHAGGGDVTLDIDFARGRVVKANGKVSAGGLEFAASDGPSHSSFALDHVRGEWHLAQRESGWRLQVASLELGDLSGHVTPATLDIDAAASGEWLRGTLAKAPLQSVAAFAQWFAPRLDLSGVGLGGTVQNVVFDWNRARPEGRRLRANARLADVAIAPASHGFALTGMAGHVYGDETALVAELQTRSARLELAQSPRYPLEDVRVNARLKIDRDADAWRITTEKLELQHEMARLTVEGLLSGDDPRRAAQINAHAELTGATVPLLERLAGASMAQAFGATFSQLTAGRIERAQVDLRGAFDETLPLDGMTGTLLLRDAVLAGGDLWPDAHDVDARIEWRGPRLRASIDTGQAGAFALSATKADWDVRGEHLAHIAGHVTGPLQDAVAWMRSHPKLREYAPRIQNMEISGTAGVDFNVTLPGSEAHVTAALDDARLRPVDGMPAIDSVSGMLVFDGGALRRSTLRGRWLGGPVTLTVGERREAGVQVLAIQGRGTLDARELALAVTAGTAIDQTMAPAGPAQWSGELAYSADQWRVKADTSLVGVVSHLPEPLAKTADAAVPLHVTAQGTAAAAQLRLSLGDRLRSLLALRRRADATWQVERGDLRFDTQAVELPDAPLVLVQGRIGTLDLPAYVAAWQLLRQQPGAPVIRADVSADRMLVAGSDYADVRVLAERTDTGADLKLQSEQMMGVAHWPAVVNASHRARVHFAKLNIPDGSAFAASAELIAALGPATDFSVDNIIWQGRSIGSGAATIQSGGNVVDVTDLRLDGGSHDVTGTMRCEEATCRLSFNLDSHDAAATLEDFGFKPELTAAVASLYGDLQWSVAAHEPALATLAGRLNMHFENGATRADTDPEEEGDGTPLGILLVPALVRGLQQPAAQRADLSLQTAEAHELHFSRLEADFEVNEGVATTSNLHFDGDAEIMMRGRTGLLARDYDQQVWILRGEGRLPAAVRRLAPTPPIAAAWLSLRELFGGGSREESAKAALHLQGSWDDPIVVVQ